MGQYKFLHTKSLGTGIDGNDMARGVTENNRKLRAVCEERGCISTGTRARRRRANILFEEEQEEGGLFRLLRGMKASLGVHFGRANLLW